MVGDMGWVDFDFGCFTVSQILPWQMRIWQNWVGTGGTWWNIKFKVNTTHVLEHFCHPVHCIPRIPEMANTFWRTRPKTVPRSLTIMSCSSVAPFEPGHGMPPDPVKLPAAPASS